MSLLQVTAFRVADDFGRWILALQSLEHHLQLVRLVEVGGNGLCGSPSRRAAGGLDGEGREQTLLCRPGLRGAEPAGRQEESRVLLRPRGLDSVPEGGRERMVWHSGRTFRNRYGQYSRTALAET